MKIALIGATGNVGSRILAELLNRNHEVTGVVRHPEKLPARAGLTAKRGDINDEAGLAQLLAGHDAVIGSVEDYAIALVDELETPRHSRQRFTVGY